MRTRRIGVGAVVAIVTAEAVGQWLSHRLPRLDRRKRTAIIVLGYRADDTTERTSCSAGECIWQHARSTHSTTGG